MEIRNSIVSWLMKKRYHQIELFMKYPYDVQLEWFNRLITAARDTEWGKRFDYASIKTREEYRKIVDEKAKEMAERFGGNNRRGGRGGRGRFGG